MTTEEWYNLPRFTKEECKLPPNYKIYENDIFEVHKLNKTIAYVIVLQNFYNSFILLNECDQQGNLIPKNLERFETRIENIMFLIEYENLWRLYKSGHKITDAVNSDKSDKFILSLQPPEYTLERASHSFHLLLNILFNYK